jgi:hypothetical protein
LKYPTPVSPRWQDSFTLSTMFLFYSSANVNDYALRTGEAGLCGLVTLSDRCLLRKLV